MINKDKIREIIKESIINTQQNTILNDDNISRLVETKNKKEQKYYLLEQFSSLIDEILEEQVEMVTEQDDTQVQSQPEITPKQQEQRQLDHYKRRFQAYKPTISDDGKEMRTYTEKLNIIRKDGFMYVVAVGSEYLDYIVIQKYDDKGNWLSDSSFIIGDDYNNLFVQQQNKNVNNLIDIVFGV